MVLYNKWFKTRESGEMVKFPATNIFGMAKLRKEYRGIVIFGNDFNVKAGDDINNR
jgi:F0F1-type ATP synthase alpha subunit